MNFELTSFLEGDIENAVQVMFSLSSFSHFNYHLNRQAKKLLILPFFQSRHVLSWNKKNSWKNWLSLLWLQPLEFLPFLANSWALISHNTNFFEPHQMLIWDKVKIIHHYSCFFLHMALLCMILHVLRLYQLEMDFGVSDLKVEGEKKINPTSIRIRLWCWCDFMKFITYLYPWIIVRLISIHFTSSWLVLGCL